MKKALFISALLLLSLGTLRAQEDDDDNSRAGQQLRERMTEYIQKKLNLTRAEADRFNPLFIRYILELRKTHRENRLDKPVLQLRIAELRVRYRNEFKLMMDEQRANQVFEYQREFEIKIRDELDRRRSEGRPFRRPGLN